MFSLRLGDPAEDPVRIAAAIVSGVGFLGAGVVLRHRGEIVGITTAATIWLAAALGMGIGSGNYTTTAVAAGALLTVLWVFPLIEFRVDRARETNTYSITAEMTDATHETIRGALLEHDLLLFDKKIGEADGMLQRMWKVAGSQRGHEAFAKTLLDVPTVTHFEY